MPANVLSRDFYCRDARQVARDLIGCRLICRLGRQRTSGVIVETEAYLERGDSACHGYRGPTQRTKVMFGIGGMAYVYPIHAKHCFNVVTGDQGTAAAVLIRALQPVEGIRTMSQRRRTHDVHALACGPARLCQALSINCEVNGLDLTVSRKIWLEFADDRDQTVPRKIRCTTRIGVTSAKHLKLRFVAAANPFASGPKHLR